MLTVTYNCTCDYCNIDIMTPEIHVLNAWTPIPAPSNLNRKLGPAFLCGECYRAAQARLSNRAHELKNPKGA